ncbi:hypothetical protein GCM10009527_061980 [Actinomadura nitritigenes]|uniref:DUF3071 domain-containing protein n=1 Tax=Actinomadura nitritigenes TaxID=134602 RepID=A0ABS3QW87_9ACTN|nr:septation protein SepH [Actinomadura nitritigenes]MBO2438224.1 DUF3071 domain-containing protein [Actinomadura nitritigenes]
MQELRLVAVSEDGTYLVLATAGRGTRFTLPVDDRLRAAVRGHFSRLGQFEIEVESPLRPKEIQARIRSGETAEEIAESAGIPVERVRWFEGPVLQEREYMAQQAQRVAVRRPGETTLGPPLGETVEERLGRGGVDLEEVEWDSWKCEDSTWRVRLSFFDNGRPHAAEWSFDPRRRHVSPLDEIAARLTAVEWDDETLSDTVTPLVPRRPAMKVVQNDRLPNDGDVAARGLPAEPEQPAAPGPLRPAEPPQYIVERGRMVDPRPAFRDAPGEGAPLREASRPLSSDGPREAPRLREAPEPARPAEDVRPRDDRSAREEEPRVPQARREAPAEDVESRTESAAEEAGLLEREESRSEAASDAPEILEEARPAEAEASAEESRTSQGAAEDLRPEASEDVQASDERQGAENPDAAVPAETAKAGEDGRPDGVAAQDEDAQDEDAQASREEPGEDGSRPAPADEEPAPQEAEATQAHDEPDEAEEAEDAPAAAAALESEQPASDGGEAARDRSPAPERPAPAPEEKAARPDPAPQQPAPQQPAQQQPAQHPARREPSRPPAKKKPARPPMPAAAQDKPVTGSPAAAAAESAAQRPARPRRKAKGKRASVPSWDEIMFGARRPE